VARRTAKDDLVGIEELQRIYHQAVIDRGVPQAILDKLKRMREMYAKALSTDPPDEKASDEAGKLAIELSPILQFEVDDLVAEMGLTNITPDTVIEIERHQVDEVIKRLLARRQRQMMRIN